MRDLMLLQNIHMVVMLGKIAFDEYLRTCKVAGQTIPAPRQKISHGAEYLMPWNVTFLGSCHSSQQNALTGKLTRPMFHHVFSQAKNLVEQS